MGTVELWIMIAVQAAVIIRFYLDYRAMRFLADYRGDKILDLEAEIKGFKAQGVLAKPAVYQLDKADPKKPPVYNGSIARRMMERRNAEFFSADKKIPNSEIVKENANG